MKVYKFKNPDTKLYVGDCRRVLMDFPPNFFTLIFCDPPFGRGVDYGDEYDDNLSDREYEKFTAEWIDICVDKLSEKGTLWLHLPDRIVSYADLRLRRKHKLERVNWIIWHFRFGQCVNSKFINSKAHGLYFCRDMKNRIWNPEWIESDRVTYGDSRTQKTKNPGKRVPLDVWYGENWGRIQGNNRERSKAHPNQLPELYLKRIIKCCTNEGDTVLDAFCGSGTSLVVARALNRKSVGIEVSEKNARNSIKRIKKGAIRC